MCVQSLKPEFGVVPCGGMHIICDGRFEGYETTLSHAVDLFSLLRFATSFKITSVYRCCSIGEVPKEQKKNTPPC